METARRRSGKFTGQHAAAARGRVVWRGAWYGWASALTHKTQCGRLAGDTGQQRQRRRRRHSSTKRAPGRSHFTMRAGWLPSPVGCERLPISVVHALDFMPVQAAQRAVHSILGGHGRGFAAWCRGAIDTRCEAQAGPRGTRHASEVRILWIVIRASVWSPSDDVIGQALAHTSHHRPPPGLGDSNPSLTPPLQYAPRAKPHGSKPTGPQRPWASRDSELLNT